MSDSRSITLFIFWCLTQGPVRLRVPALYVLYSMGAVRFSQDFSCKNFHARQLLRSLAKNPITCKTFCSINTRHHKNVCFILHALCKSNGLYISVITEKFRNLVQKSTLQCHFKFRSRSTYLLNAKLQRKQKKNRNLCVTRPCGKSCGHLTLKQQQKHDDTLRHFPIAELVQCFQYFDENAIRFFPLSLRPPHFCDVKDNDDVMTLLSAALRNVKIDLDLHNPPFLYVLISMVLSIMYPCCHLLWLFPGDIYSQSQGCNSQH